MVGLRGKLSDTYPVAEEWEVSEFAVVILVEFRFEPQQRTAGVWEHADNLESLVL